MKLFKFFFVFFLICSVIGFAYFYVADIKVEQKVVTENISIDDKTKN